MPLEDDDDLFIPVDLDAEDEGEGRPPPAPGREEGDEEEVEDEDGDDDDDDEASPDSIIIEEDTEEDEEDKVVEIPSLVEDEEIAKTHETSAVLKIWEERLKSATEAAAAGQGGVAAAAAAGGGQGGPPAFNPVPILTRLAEIFEFETIEYLKLDPDPFDERHPSKTHPDCALGHSLKVLFKKETFVNKLSLEYMREIWGEELDLEVNTAACRLFVSILSGVESSTLFQDTDGLILRLFNWAETAPEPLKSYSLGMLGAAMEVPEIAGKFKEKNVHLVQVMIKRLRELQNEYFSTQNKLNLSSRPFARFSSSNQLKTIPEGKVKEELRIPGSTPSTPILTNGNSESAIESPVASGKGLPVIISDSENFLDSATPPTSTVPSLPVTPKSSKIFQNGTPSTPKTPSSGSQPNVTPSRSAKRSRAAGTPVQKHFLEPTAQNQPKRRKVEEPELDDCSSTSSSWAELEPNIIGQWQVFPVNLVTRQIFILRYLAPLGEYQEMLGYAFQQNAIQIIMRYLSKSRQTKETSRLTFEAVKYLGSLLCHKKFALEFLEAGGLQKLLQIPRPSLSATGVALCLYYIAYCEDAMEKICLMPKTVLQNLINYALWLLECSHHLGRTHACMFFGVIYPFKILLDMFDAQDGLRAILNVITTQPVYIQMKKTTERIHRNQSTLDQSIMNDDDATDIDIDLSEDVLSLSRQSIKQVSFNLKRYFECHLGFTADKLRRTIGKNHSHPHAAGPVLPSYKALKSFSALELSNMHSTVLNLLPENAQRWAPVDRFLNQSGLEVIMQTVAMAYEWSWSGRGEAVRNMLDTLSICCLVPRTQILLTERYKLNGSNEHSGLSVVLSAAEGEIVNEPEVKKSALQVIGNCVCGPIHHKKPTEMQIKIWECARVDNGILILTRLLQTKSPITDADSIRAMACWCLSGLARYKHVRQVLQQLPLIRSGTIQNLMTEPILQDKRHDHAMFQKYAMEIIKLVHGKEDNFALDLGDLIRKSDIISQSKIDYYETELTELIHDHLVKAGLSQTAAVLQMEAKSRNNYNISNAATKSPISLDKIVRQYLLNQHALCKTPMVTCPTFDLLKPHKCPSKSDTVRTTDFRTSSTNFASRFFKRQMGGCMKGHEDRKLIYSRYKPIRVLRSTEVSHEEDMCFTSCAYSPDHQWIAVGTSHGDVKLFNMSSYQEEGNYTCHDSEIYHLEYNDRSSLLLTSNIWRRPFSALWRMEGLFEKVMEFERDEYVEFSKLAYDKVICTNNGTTTIYDVETKQKLMTLRPRISNQYLKNRATFDPNDELILSDGVLWDFKSGKEVHKFDKLNENLNGVFNPRTGLEIISNTEIWDVRTFHLLKTVRQLDQCLLKFTNDGSVIYGVRIEREEHPSGDGTISFRYSDTSFVVIDNLDDYSSIATIELKRHIISLAPSPSDLQLALVENHSSAMDDNMASPDSCVRFYEIGRTRADELSNADGIEVAKAKDDEDGVQSNDDDDVDDDDDDDDDDDGLDEDETDEDNDEEIDADNDLDRLLDGLLGPNQMLFNNDVDDNGDSSSSWEVEEEEDDDSSDDSNDSD